MKLSDCIEVMRTKSESFALINKLTPKTRLGITEKYDLIVIQEDNSEEVFSGLLLGSFSEENEIFQFPYHKENPAIPDKDRAMYLTLQEFGLKNKIIELTEVNLAFNPFAIGITSIMRRLEKPTINRNEMGEIESSYSLEEILAIAGTFHKVRAIVPLTFENHVIYIGIFE